MAYEEESVADWYLRRGLDFSHSGRIKEILFLVAAEKITAFEAARFIEIWGIGKGSRTWETWVAAVNKIAQAAPGSLVCLAPSDDAEIIEDRPTKIVVAAAPAKTKRGPRRSAAEIQESGDPVNSGEG